MKRTYEMRNSMNEVVGTATFDGSDIDGDVAADGEAERLIARNLDFSTFGRFVHRYENGRASVWWLEALMMSDAHPFYVHITGDDLPPLARDPELTF